MFVTLNLVEDGKVAMVRPDKIVALMPVQSIPMSACGPVPVEATAGGVLVAQERPELVGVIVEGCPAMIVRANRAVLAKEIEAACGEMRAAKLREQAETAGREIVSHLDALRDEATSRRVRHDPRNN